MTGKRIELIDALRGFSVSLMVVHHLLYDLVEFLDAPGWLFSNPVLDFLHFVFAGVFIALSGVSSQFSRSNIRRGLKVYALALCITLVTTAMDMPIRFGILHLLGFSMLLYGFTRKLWDKIPRKTAIILYAVLFAAGLLAVKFVRVKLNFLWMFGFLTPGFISYDYFPVLPWLFVFLAGTWAGLYITENKLPGWFYNTRVAVFPAIGRKSLVIYLLHQPVLYGLVMLISVMVKA